MPTPKQQYVKKLNEIARRYGRMEDATVKRAISMLRDLRRDIAAEIGTTEWSQHRIRELTNSMNRLIARFQGRLSAEFQGAMNSAIADGGAYVIEPIRAAGIGVSFFQPSTAQVNVALDFSADLIRDIGGEMRRKVNNQIRLAMMGERGPFDAMKEITRIMGLERAGVKDRWGRKKKIVKGIRYGAERILRTELQRGFNLATHSQQLAVAEREPELRKRWIATADARTRDSHIAAHIKYMDAPILISEPYIVGGAKLMFPGDPAGPANETISCRCREVTIHPLIGNIGTPLEAKIRAEQAKRKEVTEKARRAKLPEAERMRLDVIDIAEREQARIASLKSKEEEVWQKVHQIHEEMRAIQEVDLDDPRLSAMWEEVGQLTIGVNAIIDKRRGAERALLTQTRRPLLVDNPANFDVKQVTRMKEQRRASLEAGIEGFSQLVGTGTMEGVTVEFRGTGRGRSYHHAGNVWLSTNPRSELSTIHELGHVLEYRDPEVHRKALEFLEQRTAGEKEAWLGDHYDKREKSRKDEFIDPYMGKDYGGRATEIVSMGLEIMHADPARLAREDPGFFDFMFNLLRGQ